MVEKRGESDNITNKLVLKKAVESKINHLLGKPSVSEKEVYDLIREFFKKYLGVDFEFTSDELVRELRRVYVTPDMQERIHNLMDRVSEIEYLSKKFSSEELNVLLQDFKILVDELIVYHYENKSLFKKVKDVLCGSVSKKHKKVMEDSEKNCFSETERRVVKMNMLLDDAKRLLKKDDVHQAKQVYTELIDVYNGLSEEKKKAYYPLVTEVYGSINSKEKSI